jgi:hypothetical protein
MDRQSLEQLAEEVESLLRNRDFPVLAERFGYAVALGRDPALAMEADFSISGMEAELPGTIPFIDIRYFDEQAHQAAGLAAAIDCGVYLPDDSALRFSLVVTGNGTQRHVSLKSIERLRRIGTPVSE